MISIEHAKIAFDKYVEQFDTDDPKISLKLRHTYYVMDTCEYLAKEMKLNDTDLNLSILIGLLHDIGRFEQLTRFNSYDDNIIYHAIKNHSAYAITPGLNEQELLHAQIIRDADKIDNYRVKRDDPVEAILDMSAEELGTYDISDHIFKTFASHKTILKNNRKSPMESGYLSLLCSLILTMHQVSSIFWTFFQKTLSIFLQ